MSSSIPEIEDLTREKVRDRTLGVELSAEELVELQAEADKRGVTLDAYVRWRLLTAAAVASRGGSPTSRGGAA